MCHVSIVGGLAVMALATACSGGDASGGSSGGGSSGGGSAGSTVSGALASCGEAGRELTGGTYDVSRSRFAFGSTPTQQSAPDGSTRWVGAYGVLSIYPLGGGSASSNADSPARGRPDWSADTDALTKHVVAYFSEMGIPACQVETFVTSTAGGGGPVGEPAKTTYGNQTVGLRRVADGIPVVESTAWATIDDQDQSTAETFWWPTLPAASIDEAIAFRDRLTDPAQDAAYRAKLPSDAATGQVVIHHSLFFLAKTLKVVVAYDANIHGRPVSYDANGAEIPQGSW